MQAKLCCRKATAAGWGHHCLTRMKRVWGGWLVWVLDNGAAQQGYMHACRKPGPGRQCVMLCGPCLQTDMMKTIKFRQVLNITNLQHTGKLSSSGDMRMTDPLSHNGRQVVPCRRCHPRALKWNLSHQQHAGTDSMP